MLAGPFAGMRLGPVSSWGAPGPNLLGTYELELAPIVEGIVASGCRRFVVVGAADGWYAVGLLARLPAAMCVAFETSERGRATLREGAVANGVADRLEIRGRCGVADLVATVAAFGPQIVICDIEGGERDLLDPAKIPGLADIDVIVEIHDFVDPTTGATLASRFRATHDIARIASRPRRAADLPAVAGFTRADLLVLADEHRPGRMEWFSMRSRGGGSRL